MIHIWNFLDTNNEFLSAVQFWRNYWKQELGDGSNKFACLINLMKNIGQYVNMAEAGNVPLGQIPSGFKTWVSTTNISIFVSIRYIKWLEWFVGFIVERRRQKMVVTLDSPCMVHKEPQYWKGKKLIMLYSKLCIV